MQNIYQSMTKHTASGKVVAAKIISSWLVAPAQHEWNTQWSFGWFQDSTGKEPPPKNQIQLQI